MCSTIDLTKVTSSLTIVTTAVAGYILRTEFGKEEMQSSEACTITAPFSRLYDLQIPGSMTVYLAGLKSQMSSVGLVVVDDKHRHTSSMPQIHVVNSTCVHVYISRPSVERCPYQALMRSIKSGHFEELCGRDLLYQKRMAQAEMTDGRLVDDSAEVVPAASVVTDD